MNPRPATVPPPQGNLVRKYNYSPRVTPHQFISPIFLQSAKPWLRDSRCVLVSPTAQFDDMIRKRKTTPAGIFNAVYAQ